MWSLPISMRSFFFFTLWTRNASPSNGKVLVLTTSECQQIAEWWNGGNTMSYEDWMGFWLTGWAWSKSKECLQKHEDLGANSIQLAMRFRDGKAWGEVIWSHPIRSNSSGTGDKTTWKNISCIDILLILISGFCRLLNWSNLIRMMGHNLWEVGWRDSRQLQSESSCRWKVTAYFTPQRR